MKFLELLKQVIRGHSLARALMNARFGKEKLEGTVLDVGGGRNPDYFDFFDMTEVSSTTPVDQKIQSIDFEKDLLPKEDNSIESVVCANVLEHIYNHEKLISEMHRIIRPKGNLIGFVPFLVQYHPDPHDYFRYTNEALKKLLENAGFSFVVVEPLSFGPIGIFFSLFQLSLPRIISVPIFVLLYPCAKFSLFLKPSFKERYPLGYFFKATK